MTDKIKIGKEGEDEACRYLESEGYQIMEKNFRYGSAEIDIIAERQGWLVFTEVKLRSGGSFGPPEIFVNRAKRDNIRRAAREYLYRKNWSGNLRFDVIAITRRQGRDEIFHITDAFH